MKEETNKWPDNILSVENRNKAPILEIKNLCYSYDKNVQTLKGINLKIHKGEKIAVLGSNGAGKSTLFLNMNGVYRPDDGEIFFNNELINKKNINELRKNVGIVFQDADSQIIASTVKAEISFGPINMKLERDEVIKRVTDAMKYMNITDFADRPPHYLSGGEKKRVSIADIIAMKPDMIIFDEPTASLDPLNAGMLEEILNRLSQENKTIIVSTHDIDFAYRWAERIIVMSGGKIIADDAPYAVFNNDEIIKKANLKKPVMLEVAQILKKAGVLEADGKDNFPKNIAELEHLMAGRSL